MYKCVICDDHMKADQKIRLSYEKGELNWFAKKPKYFVISHYNCPKKSLSQENSTKESLVYVKNAYNMCISYDVTLESL